MQLDQSAATLIKLITQEALVIDLAHGCILAMNDSFHDTFGLSVGAPIKDFNALFHNPTALSKVGDELAIGLSTHQTSTCKEISILTLHHGVRNFSLKVSYVDDTRTAIYLIFSKNPDDNTQKPAQHGYYEIITTASFSYPFYLDVNAKRIEFFGPILEQFKLPNIMENFPEPVIAGGMILEEDLEGYLAMVERMYRGDAPSGTFRTYTPTGDILRYGVNYTVIRDKDGAPEEIIGDFINTKENPVDTIVKTTSPSHSSENTVLVHQIRAHFFFNTLNTISALCKQDAAKADQAIKTFAAYMRSYMYLITEEENIPFAQELSLIKSSLEIEHLRFPNSFSYHLDLNYLDFDLPPLSLQPIVENALMHGLRKTGHHGKLRISTEKHGDMVHIIVADNGKGFDTAILETNKSIGLKNLTKRVNLMAGGTISLESALNKGTKVTIVLPI